MIAGFQLVLCFELLRQRAIAFGIASVAVGTQLQKIFSDC